jgi:hypothetical protein
MLWIYKTRLLKYQKKICKHIKLNMARFTLFIYSFNKYLPNTNCMPGIILGVGNPTENRKMKSPLSKT